MYCAGKETRRRARSGVVVSFLFIDAQLMNSQWEGRKGVNEGGKQKLLFSSLFIVYTLIQQQQQQEKKAKCCCTKKLAVKKGKVRNTRAYVMFILQQQRHKLKSRIATSSSSSSSPAERAREREIIAVCSTLLFAATTMTRVTKKTKQRIRGPRTRAARTKYVTVPL